ncbi:uncharacterized protein LOC110817943 [Carica papaya]|uniref:uncharacterized protein LOC110817943 n=1 Tax=Carica papaya TaxID=3649 RepID=UPI000B8CB42D|nr:uncharacterized protein LOC110817943 [Carica papaya]
MSCFRGRILYNINILALFVFFLMSILTSSECRTSMAEDDQNPLSYELWSREEMVRMAGYGEDKLSTVLVAGTVVCEACLSGEHELRVWPVPGASVTVKCSKSGESKWVWERGMTDEYGDFLIDLPSQLHATPNLEKTCYVKVLRLPTNSQCRPAYVKKQKGLKLSSVGNGIRTYSAGRIRFQHFTSKSSPPCIRVGTGGTKQIA